MKVNWREVQALLEGRGFNPGPIDGIFGPKTSAAVIAYKKSVGLRARDYVGPITLASLRNNKNGFHVRGTVLPSAEPSWLKRARVEIGVREYRGASHNKRVLGYWELSRLAFSDDETPWCAGYVGAMLEDVGIKSTRSGMARSYMNWGQPVDDPIKGAVVVFWRGSRYGSSGHVGFVTGKDQYGNIMVLGGNQSDAVNIKPFSTDRVLGYRWPTGVPLPGEKIKGDLDLVESDGRVSANEA